MLLLIPLLVFLGYKWVSREKVFERQAFKVVCAFCLGFGIIMMITLLILFAGTK